MPIYEYECSACGHYLEAIQKISEAPLTDCPGCGAQGQLKKLVSAAGFRLKGTGWYETDFKHRGKKPADKTAAAKTDKPPETNETSVAPKPPSSDKKAAEGAS